MPETTNQQLAGNFHMTATCKICEAPTDHFGRQLVLAKFDAEYRRCRDCGYVFIVDPHWLDEAYSNAIAALDTGIVTRNLWLADATSALLALSLRDVRRTLDFGGGSGLLVRLMRDRGHDFSWYDAYCPNVLAAGFEAAPDDQFDMVTAFELFEHLLEPIASIERLRAMAPVIVFSTELVPAGVRGPDKWWYFAPESGQHIGFFTVASLTILARRFGLELSTNGRNLHVLAPHRVSSALLSVLGKPSRASWLAKYGIRRSLAHRDAALLQARLRTAGAPGEPQEHGRSSGL